MLRNALTCCSLLVSVWLPATAAAVELYRYVDEKGVTVLSRQGVPPEVIGKGYDVLNEQGRVIRVVPPAPTAEELEKLKADKARARSDEQLLRLYSTPEDVERARERKFAEIDGLLSIARGNLQGSITQQGNLQAQAADHERSGREVPANLLQQIETQKLEQKRLNIDIERYEAARQEAEKSFTADRERLGELLQQIR
ncbi:DUF4124 domain-containing protein [Pseudomonas sp. TTU2014-080ASC]|uniref:DUF4124 domain-containing protein n=1 Tax=Pseudomonas sp. TTU2014-080ASC TaxID=1729724 RepID=UPI0007184181|nr:DUF4124 domain-containing protein [Pseudomonas sp. TTU2014-080ASC]KRW61267.1 hypothetical protein AO726_08025 [Pseudomonas sp. TTU2014-080ASC]